MSEKSPIFKSHKSYKNPLGTITMKNIYYIIFLITLIGCSDCYNADLKRNGLFGKVKSVKEISFRVGNSNTEFEKLDTIKIREKKYDSLGFLESDYLKFQFNDNYFSGKYFYNSDSLLVKEIGKMDNQQNEIIVDYFYSDKKIIKTKGYVKENNGDFDIESFQIENYLYKDGELIECEQNSYTVNSKNKDTTYTSGYISKFDKNQHVIEVDWKVIDTIYPTSKYKYFRNCNGLIIKEESTNKMNNRKNIFVFKYDYDKTGNWILKRKFENDTIKQLVKRIIEYK